MKNGELDIMTHNEYTDKLKRGVFEVTFNKISGEQRIMNCTLHPRVLPKAVKEDTMSQKKVRELNEEVVSVWDVKASGWRAFRVENVTDFKRLGAACTCGKTQSAVKTCDGSHSNA